MDTTRISIARLLALGVPLTWQDAIAVAQEAAMRSDVDAAMEGSAPLVSGETCYITPDGDVDLPVTTDVESPDAIRVLLGEMLAGLDAPDALKSLAHGHVTHDMYGELARFPVPNRRAEIAKLATRALALQAGRHRGPPQASVTTSVTTPATTPATEPGAAPRAVSVPPPWRRAPEPAPALVADAPAPMPPPRPAPLPVVPDAGLAPPVAVTAELQRLRLQSVNASATRRRPARFTASRIGTWIAAGALASGVLATLVWSAGSARGTRGTPALLEAKGVNMLPVWPFAASVGRISPGAYTTRPPEFVTASRASTPLDYTSIAIDNSLWPAASASPLGPNADATGVESPLRDGNSGGDVVAAPRVPGDARADLASIATASATAAPTASVPTSVDAPSVVANTAPVRRAGGGARGRAFRRETFSAGDADVAPPDLRRQQLPTSVLEPGTAVPEGWPYLMLVVDETGVVESVRLTAPTPPPGQSLYRHRMLVAAAKAWQFLPARKNGQPVRYAIQVPLEP